MYFTHASDQLAIMAALEGTSMQHRTWHHQYDLHYQLFQTIAK